ncbi:MAG TPA: universal stress protein [Solirubrobacteraceae bacterium]|jgi:nucleotide-binding universal stress UspA family protein
MPENSTPTIVVGADGTDRCNDALTFAARLAGPHCRLLIVNAYPSGGYSSLARPTDWLSSVEDEAQRKLALAETQLPDSVAAETRAIAADSPAHALHDTAEGVEASLIVIGSTHRGVIGRAIAGTTAERLLNGAPCPVVVVPHGFAESQPPIHEIGVAWDGSPEADAALSAATVLAGAIGANLRIIRAFTVPVVFAGMGAVAPAASLEDDVRDAAAADVDSALDLLAAEHRPEAEVVHGAAGQVLVERSEGLDLLVCGSRGYGPLRAVLLGSVTAHVLSHAGCPVVVVPRGVTSPLEWFGQALSDLALPAARGI